MRNDRVRALSLATLTLWCLSREFENWRNSVPLFSSLGSIRDVQLPSDEWCGWHKRKSQRCSRVFCIFFYIFSTLSPPSINEKYVHKRRVKNEIKNWGNSCINFKKERINAEKHIPHSTVIIIRLVLLAFNDFFNYAAFFDFFSTPREYKKCA